MHIWWTRGSREKCGIDVHEDPDGSRCERKGMIMIEGGQGLRDSFGREGRGAIDDGAARGPAGLELQYF